MRARLALILAGLCWCHVPSIDAQTLVSNGLDRRFEAINAIFRFREDLRDSGTVIAACRLFNVRTDSTQSNALDARFRGLLVLPATTDTTRLKQCGVSEFAVEKTRVLWLEGLVEIHRVGAMRLTDQLQFEITFQLLLGPGYREFHRYLVGPAGINTLDPRTDRSEFSGWRVLEYKFVGGDYHWGNSLGAGSGFRRRNDSR